MIPGLLDDYERLRIKGDEAEQECERLRQEIGELRKQVSDLQSETHYFRNEYAAMVEVLGSVLEHIGQLQTPLQDVYRRLQIIQPAGPASSTG